MSSPRPRSLRLLGWAAFFVFAIVMVVFWTWALFITKPDRVNRIEDTEWTEWAESRCAAASTEMNKLADFTRVKEDQPDLVRQRAAIIDDANLIVAELLDELSARSPNDPKGLRLIPAWLERYRLYLADRELYADELRRTGENSLFVETITEEGIPTSELLETFANDNNMPSCAPKRDLS